MQIILLKTDEIFFLIFSKTVVVIGAKISTDKNLELLYSIPVYMELHYLYNT